MKVRINDTLRITTDTYQYRIERWIRSKKDSNEGEWRPDLFYPELHMLLNDITRFKLDRATLSTLDDLVAMLAVIRAEQKAIGGECKTFWGVNPQ